eukprot:2687744-Pyramimonas_sp.AAC.1
MPGRPVQAQLVGDSGVCHPLHDLRTREFHRRGVLCEVRVLLAERIQGIPAVLRCVLRPGRVCALARAGN